MSDIKTLGEELAKEQARIRECMLRYKDPMLKVAGAFAAMFMEQALQNADKAIISGDIVAMLQSYNELKGYTE